MTFIMYNFKNTSFEYFKLSFCFSVSYKINLLDKPDPNALLP